MNLAQHIQFDTQTEFRKFLNREFLLRCEKNPRYSLRAFAQQIGVDSTLLSRLLKGQRRFTNPMISRICTELDIPIDQMQWLVQANQSEKSRAKLLSEENFGVLSKWYFFAILELFSLKDFDPNPKWISEKLNLSLSETQSALQILKDNGHLQFKDNKWIVNTESSNWTNYNQTTKNRRSYQKQLLEKARSAIDAVPFEQRENASLTIAADKALIPEIKERIQKFKNEIQQLINEHGQTNEVYQLVFSYFPLTQNTYSNEEINGDSK